MHVAKVAIIGIVALAVAAPAFAQETRVDRRQERQEQRVDQGVKSGALTPRETEKLETKAQADGKVTAKEKVRLEHAQGVQSERIYNQKHDKQTR